MYQFRNFFEVKKTVGGVNNLFFYYFQKGGGKGKIKHYVTPVRAGRVFMEVCGDMYWEEVKPWLRNITRMLPFEAIGKDNCNKNAIKLQS